MRSTLAILVVLLAANVAFAQGNAGNSSAPAQATTTAPPAAQHQPQAKSAEEYGAYNAAAALTDPGQIVAAADAFVQKYPNSELKELLYVRAMQIYQQQNNSAQVITAGRKAIAINPQNPVTLIEVASALVMDTRENDLDREARFAEAAKDAQAGIDNIDTGLQVPPTVSAAQVAAAKANYRSIAYETLGIIAMNGKDYATAEQNFQKAADFMKDQPEAEVYLRLSVVQDNQKKYPEALDSANKALQYAAEGSAEKNLAKQQQARLQKLISEQAATAPAATTPH